jgi:aspartate aminotransferase-like enzyme
LVVDNGKFSERWVKVCATFGIEHTRLPLEWGRGAKRADIAAALERDSAIDTVIVVHSETSTTALSDVKEIADLCRAGDVLLLVDGITAVGVLPVKVDEWGVDAYVTGSQKAMMLPPGLAFAAIGDRAWSRIDSGTMPTLYNDLKAYRKSLETWDAPYTPAVSLMRGAIVALRMIRERGLESIWAEASCLARAMRASAEALGLKLFAMDPADSVTAVMIPDGVDEAVLRKTMRERHGFHVAGGQGDLKGKIVRFSHMGYVDSFDTLGAVSALEMALREQGYAFEMGAGVSAAHRVLAGCKS